MIIDGQEYITEKEIASMCGVSRRWVKGMRHKDKKFPCYQLNGRIFFKEPEVMQWLKEHMKAV